MKHLATAGVLAIAALAGCSPSAQNETAEAADAVGADLSATTANATSDVEAATDRALGSAEQTLDEAGRDIERGADRTGAAIANGADRAAEATGEALTDAGNSLKN